jgi:4-hydroxybenzoate polyprenyltransferase
MSRVRDWLRLVRVVALPTALADVWLGAAWAFGFWTWRVVVLSAVSLCLYAAGMILNDVHDVEHDRRVNPDRPLPAGRIETGKARGAGVGLLTTGVVIAAALGRETLAVAAALAALIILYDFVTKSTPLGPMNMGLCRAGNVLLGVSAAPGFMVLVPLLAVAAAAPVLVYITVVTMFARHEAESPRIRKGVGYALVGIVPLQAALAALYGRLDAAVAILGLMVPMLLLRRLSHVT